MAAIANDIDKILQATVPRFTPPTDRGMFLSPSSAIFKVAGNGTASPGSITFRATLLNMTGAVTYTATDGLTLTISGNDATLTYANMSALSGTITATITVDGVLYTQIAMIAKVADGTAGTTSYTWIKYADSAAGAGLTDDPTGKAYIGLAYNKTTATESTTATDYTWSLIKGTDGQPGEKGADGATTYTWIKYADQADGTGLYDLPTANTLYIGIAVNKTTATESTLKTDYVWSKFKGDQGVPGNTGNPGPRGNVNISAATGSSVWVDAEAVAALSAASYGAPQVKDVVTLYNTTTGFTKTKIYSGSAWQDLALVLDGALLAKGTVFSDALATGSVTARSIAVSGNGDNLIADPRMTDLVWWGMTGVMPNVAPTDWNTAQAGVNTGWKWNQSTFIGATAGQKESLTRGVPVCPGATYLVEFQVNLSQDFQGSLSVWWSLPWWTTVHDLSQPALALWPDGYGIHYNSSSVKGVRKSIVQTVTLPNDTRLVLSAMRIRANITAGTAEVGGWSITRVSDSVLIKDGAITAQKISVTQIDAVTARIGTLRTSTSGARIEISDNLIEGFASNNVRRYRISAD